MRPDLNAYRGMVPMPRHMDRSAIPKFTGFVFAMADCSRQQIRHGWPFL